jgi:WD40 repeat protein
LPRLFISHSSQDSVAAIAFKQWLSANGWPDEDVFLDLQNIGGGERWKDALRKAHSRCEAVILLASPEALASPECLTEVRKAEDFGKEIIVVLLHDLTIDDRRLDSYKERQIVDLSAPPQSHAEKVQFRDAEHEVSFNSAALAKVKDYLVRRGITPESFPWPPEGKPDVAPFPGLSAFTEDDAAIFFGRDADILAGLDEFRLLRRKGSPRFLAVQAASGAGKSSFLRAGLWPRLSRDPDFAPLGILRPAQGILTGPEGLGEKLAARLSRPGAPINPGDIYTRLMADDVTKASAEFARLLTAAAQQAHDQRRIGDPAARPPALVLAIDQAEELLAPENAAESQRLLLLVSGLMQELPAGVQPFGLLTVRADSATRLYQAITEQRLEVPKTLTLLPLPRTSYRDVIVKPIEVVARRGQKIAISAALADQLVADATGADALPLLAFTLFQLYRGFSSGGSITLEQYQAIGGVAGSIREAIKEALAKPRNAPAIPAAAEEQLACLRATFIPWLARIDPTTGEPMRRIARLDEFIGSSRAMAERLIEKRLLLADQRAGADIIEVAHESLLRQWPPLTGWLHAVADDLRVVDAAERSSEEWVRNGRGEAWLVHRDDRLSAAERVAAREDFRRRLGKDAIDYLQTCRIRESARRRVTRIIRWSAAAALVVVAILSVQVWLKRQEAFRAATEAHASLLTMESQYDLTNGNIALAIDRAERALKLVPSTASRSALFQALMEISPHVAAVFQLESQGDRALAWSAHDSLDVADGSNRLRTIEVAGAAQPDGGWDLPNIKRPQDGNRSVVRALAPLGADRMIAVFDQGTLGVYRRGSDVLRLVEANQQLSVFPTAQPVAVGQSGGLIALATADEAIVIYRCNWGTSAQSRPTCEVAPLSDARGRAVAISADEQRLAVGDAAGNVTVYDLAGKAIGAPAKFSAPINALGWSAQRDWLAVGTTKGEIAVINSADDNNPIVAQQIFGDRPITAVTWSPKNLDLVFVCNATAACLWEANTGADARNPFKPAVRLEGHRNVISRLSFAPDGARIASSATDGTVRVWSLAQDTNVTFALYADEMVELRKVVASPDRQWVAGGASDGTMQVWNAATAQAGRHFRPAEDFEVRDIAWNHDGTIAALYANDTIKIFPDAGLPPVNASIGRHAGYHLAWTGDKRMIAVPAGDAGIILLDPRSPDSEPIRIGANDPANETWGVTAIPGSSLLVVSYVGGAIKIWDVNSKQIVGTMQAPQTGDKIGVGSMSVSPDGRWLATSSGNGSVPIYDIVKRAPWQVLKTDAAEISTVAFSPDGRKLAALGADNRFYIWTLGENGAELYLSVGTILHRAIVGDATQHDTHATWLDWIAEDRIAIASGSAAISVVSIDPAKWLRRADSLALTGKRQ